MARRTVKNKRRIQYRNSASKRRLEISNDGDGAFVVDMWIPKNSIVMSLTLSARQLHELGWWCLQQTREQGAKL